MRNDLNHRGNIIPIHDFDMYYEVHGEGEPLLLLHGFTGSGADLVRIFQPLIQNYQLIIPDLRGHGRSTNPRKLFSFHQAAEDLFALLEFLQIQNCNAIGFSGGGCTLLHMSTTRPDLLNKMILVSAAPYFPQKTKEIIRQFRAEKKSEEEWQAMRKIHAHGDEQIKLLWEQASTIFESDDMNFTADNLAQIKAKTLIVQGDRDPLYPLELTIDMYKHIPNSYLWIVPDAGHVPNHPDFLESFIHYVNVFLKSSE